MIKSDFQDEWNKWEDRKDQFSYEGKNALYDYLEQYEEETGEKIELDIIALCCDYTEYVNLEDLKAHYEDIETMEQLQDNTQVIEIDSGALEDGQGRFIIANY